MSHRTNVFAQTADFINREGFEWLMHPYNNYHYYLAKYSHSKPKAIFYYALRLLSTLAATIIPVLPALYMLTRLAVIADFRSNPAKPLAMFTVYGLFGGLVGTVGFGKIVGAMVSLAGKSFAFMPALVPAPFIVGGILIIACATALYGVKALVQFIGISPKHTYPSKLNEPNLKTLYTASLLKHIETKATLRNHPDKFNMHGNGMLNGVHPTNSISSAEETIQLGKTMLDKMERLIDKHHRREEVQAEYNQLFMGQGSPNETGVYWEWKNATKAINPKEATPDFAAEETAKGNFAINAGTRRLHFAQS